MFEAFCFMRSELEMTLSVSGVFAPSLRCDNLVGAEVSYRPLSFSLSEADIGLLFFLIADTVPSSKPSLNPLPIPSATPRTPLSGFVAVSVALDNPSEARPDNPLSRAYPSALPVLLACCESD